MRVVIDWWARRIASWHQPVILAGFLMPKNSPTQHLTVVSLHQAHTHARPQYVAHPPFTFQRAAFRWQLPSGSKGPMEPTRCLSTGEGKCDQVTTSTEKSSSSSSTTTSTSFESSLAKEVVEHWTQRLDAAQVPEAHLAAQHIVAHILGVTQNELQRHSTEVTTLTKEQLEEVDRLMNCRIARMPVQYILGEWDFHSITLKVMPPVFIPRPETEQLVELAIRTLKELEAPRVLEIGCGSGAISLAILHSLPQVECVAMDQSKHAVQVTEANAVQLGLKERLTVVLGKATVASRPPLPYSSYDLVVSNPPYVLRKDLMDLQPEIMMYEDLRALDGGKDGLDVVKIVVHHANQLLLPGRKLLLEVDPCHPYLLPAWVEKQNLNLKLLKVHQDFNKKERHMEFIKTS